MEHIPYETAKSIKTWEKEMEEIENPCHNCEMYCGRDYRYCEDCEDFDERLPSECRIGCNDCGDCEYK